jgi:Flp pilus assembly protein TadD
VNPSLSAFAHRPWLATRSAVPPSPFGMLGRNEAALFQWLAEDWFQGQGTIVDAGSFLGCSAFHFAHGLRQNRNHRPTHDRVHCFDNFVVNEARTVDFLRHHFSVDVPLLGSTRPWFDRQTLAVRDLLEVHSGDFLTQAWPPQPIAILMVDIGKSIPLASRVVEQFFPWLVPGGSVVVHQDYHHPWLPWLHVAMEFLSDAFELVAPRVDSSAVFALRRPLLAGELQRASDYAFSAEEQLQLMARAIERLPPDDRAWVELACVVLRARVGEVAAARVDLTATSARWRRAAGSAFDGQVAEIDDHLDDVESDRLYSRGDYEASLLLLDRRALRAPTDPFVAYYRGRTLLAAGRRAEAEAELRRAASGEVRVGAAYADLARVLIATGRLDEADGVLQRGMADRHAAPALPEHWCQVLGAALERRGDPEFAQQTMQNAIASHGDWPEVHVLAARVAALSGRVDAAVQHLRSASAVGLSAATRCELHAELRLPS